MTDPPVRPSHRAPKLFFFVTEDWYFVSHRLPLGVGAREAGYDVSVVTRVRDHGEVIRSAGLRLIPFESSRTGVNPVVELWTIVRLVLLYRKERPDIVHHVAMKPVLYGTIAAKMAGTRRVINALAGMGWLFASTASLAQHLKPLVRWGLRYSLRTGIALVQNVDDARLVRQLGVPESNIRRIPGSGVDLARFAATREPDGVPMVLLHARLLWPKGVGEFVAAAKQLKREGVHARFVIAGEPDPLNPSSVPREQIDAWVREGAVQHVGWIEDVAELLARAAIACLPSYYGEGIPKSLIEAAAAGRPIVTTDAPGCREVVRAGENGLLVPPRDLGALTDALRLLLADGVLRRAMGARSRAIAEQNFGIDSVVRQTRELYAETALA